MKQLQRKVSRKVKGSRNRRKAIHLLAVQHVKVANQRNDFLHKLSRTIVQQYDFIAVEDINIKGMLHTHHLAKHINDASGDAFIRMLEYKAVTSGFRLVKINPRNTSKTCSRCGTITDMPLNQRQFSCPQCGFVCHRDLNASINILKIVAGLARTKSPWTSDLYRNSGEFQQAWWLKQELYAMIHSQFHEFVCRWKPMNLFVGGCHLVSIPPKTSCFGYTTMPLSDIFIATILS